jgi:hypothetical protein
MEVSTVTRSVASAGYNFLRWAGAAVAPVLAGFLAVAISPRFPFLLATASVGRQRRHDLDAARSRPPGSQAQPGAPGAGAEHEPGRHSIGLSRSVSLAAR